MLFFLRKAGEGRREGWKAKTGCAFGLLLVTAYLIYGQVAWYPLRWSNAYFTSNGFVSALTLNPVLNIMDTYRFSQEKGFDEAAVRRYYPLISAYLGVQNPDAQTLNFERVIAPNGQAPAKGYNVVIIIMESFAWNKSSFANDKINPTPVAKKLAEESVLFTQFYTPTSATARAVFATLAGIPDVSSFKTSTRNPLIVNQNMIANAFLGYEKMYFIGGSASWGNIRGIIQNNIDGLRLYEESSFPDAKHDDVWGMSDLQLFRRSHEVLAGETKPFLAVIQTAGYHRPYTIPKDNAGFEPEEADGELLTGLSFIGPEEYNSLRFQDHVLGEFFKLAKQSPYYENTVFMIFGDHGLSANRADNMPGGYQFYNLINHHVPLIVHAPKALKPRVINTTASQVDIMPTAAGLAGIGYATSALGRDILAPGYEEKDGAFLYGWAEYPAPESFIKDDYIYYGKDAARGLYNFAGPDYRRGLAAEMPEKFEYMENMASGLYETSRYMLYNNPKRTYAEERK
jgi:phosphoglycerol transferase MdoB-like AlkP superfamily enzyme